MVASTSSNAYGIGRSNATVRRAGRQGRAHRPQGQQQHADVVQIHGIRQHIDREQQVQDRTPEDPAGAGGQSGAAQVAAGADQSQQEGESQREHGRRDESGDDEHGLGR
jgi:hypothetical protein